MPAATTGPLIPGHRIGYRTLTGDQALGTVTATGWELGGAWVEITRDSDPDRKPIRLSEQASQVARIDAL